MATSRIAFLSTDDLQGFFHYDRLAVPDLERLGCHVDEVSWRSDADWSLYDLVVIRTPWDYQQDPAGFLEVLSGIAAVTRLENSLALCRWNLAKTYLRELGEQGVPVVKTVWSDDRTGPPDAQLFEALGAEELVVKPVVSANADHTYRLDREGMAVSADVLAAVFAERPWMAQPFLSSVAEEGEFSLFYFDGAYSHAVLKTPAAGDFRVQEEHGGLIRAWDPADGLRVAGERAMQALPETPLYARADLLRGGDGYLLIEIELIEPSLYFPYDAHATRRFAEAVAARVRGDSDA